MQSGGSTLNRSRIESFQYSELLESTSSHDGNIIIAFDFLPGGHLKYPFLRWFLPCLSPRFNRKQRRKSVLKRAGAHVRSLVFVG